MSFLVCRVPVPSLAVYSNLVTVDEGFGGFEAHATCNDPVRYVAVVVSVPFA